MEFQWLNQFPCEKYAWFWECELLPHISIVNNPDEGFAIGVGWLFWTLALFIDLR